MQKISIKKRIRNLFFNKKDELKQSLVNQVQNDGEVLTFQLRFVKLGNERKYFRILKN